MARRLVVIGQGYVGLPLALRAVEAGFSVVGLEVDEQRVKRLAAGDSYIEDIPSERLLAALRTGRYLPTHDYEEAAGFDVCTITVPTPLWDGVPDLRYVRDAAREIGRYLRPGCTVILESTTYPGTTEEIVLPLLEERSGLRAPGDHRGRGQARRFAGPYERDGVAGQGLRPTPPIASTCGAAAKALSSGRHRWIGTTPGSTSSRPSKKPLISSGGRTMYGTVSESL